MQPALFLDRDGVLIKHRPNYIRQWDDVIFLQQALRALQLPALAAYKIVVVTNQSLIGRGELSLVEAQEINRQITRFVAWNGGRIDAIYMCPHQPKDGCDCRKPAPGLLLQAAGKLAIDLKTSLMVGDSITDMQAGLAAGVGHLYLVRTGLGAEQENLLPSSLKDKVTVHDDLQAALAYHFNQSASQ